MNWQVTNRGYVGSKSFHSLGCPKLRIVLGRWRLKVGDHEFDVCSTAEQQWLVFHFANAQLKFLDEIVSGAKKAAREQGCEP
jgi:hypothetical protein